MSATEYHFVAKKLRKNLQQARRNTANWRNLEAAEKAFREKTLLAALFPFGLGEGHIALNSDGKEIK